MSVFCELQTQYCSHVTNVAPATLRGNIGLVSLILKIPIRASIYNLTKKLWKLSFQTNVSGNLRQ